ESFLCLLEDPTFLASEDLPPAGAEGYLFPDTYQFPLATPQERILRTMVHRFREIFGPSLARRAGAQGLTEEQAVTLASLVEEETARPEERRLVAAVFLNRLHRGMPLQSDPTVLYGRADASRTITRADLARPTPYNTYTISGLPPTPIANPGKDALEAALDPAPVDYLYFVARGDGGNEGTRRLSAHDRVRVVDPQVGELEEGGVVAADDVAQAPGDRDGRVVREGVHHARRRRRLVRGRGGRRRGCGGDGLRAAEQAHRLELPLVPVHEREVLIPEEPMERVGERHGLELDTQVARVAHLALDLRAALPAELVEDLGHRHARDVHGERVPLVADDPLGRALITS